MKVDFDEKHSLTMNVRFGIREAIYLSLVLTVCSCGKGTPGDLGYEFWTYLNKFIADYFEITASQWGSVRTKYRKKFLWDPNTNILIITNQDKEQFYHEIYGEIENLLHG